jgi:hypothetical protein
MVNNLGKVLFAAGLEFGIIVPVALILSFVSQLCSQLGLGKLGLFILLTYSASGLITYLFSPALFLKFNPRRILILSAFGLA